MKKKFIVTAILIGVGVLIMMLTGKIIKPAEINHSKTNTIIVVDKVDKYPYEVIIEEISDQSGEKHNITIRVDNENVWNLIEKGRTYFMVYSWTDSDTPHLNQIDIVDDYREWFDLNLFKYEWHICVTRSI